MTEDAAPSVTELLRSWCAGDQDALNTLLPIVYGQLKRLAGEALEAEVQGHTLSATALVHEVYLRLAGSDVEWKNRIHFMAVAARIMRRILVDHAKGKHRQKRGGAAVRVTLDEGILISEALPDRITDLDAALQKLEEFDERKSQIIEMMYFGGLSHEEVAEILRISRATVQRETRMAKTWLYNELHESQPVATDPSTV